MNTSTSYSFVNNTRLPAIGAYVDGAAVIVARSAVAEFRKAGKQTGAKFEVWRSSLMRDLSLVVS